jgi:integrase/recombinase XerD
LEKSTGDIALSKIGVREIDFFLSKKREETSDWTAKKYYLTLASAFEKALRWGYITKNPFRLAEKPKPRQLQPAHFTKEEFRSLLRVIPRGVMKDIVLCAVFTGMRRNELINLHWNQVDLEKKLIHVENSENFKTKSGKIRSVPMHPKVVKVLLARRKNTTSDFVFHNNGKMLADGKVSQQFKQYVRKAGLREKLHFHSLRHTFGTWMVDAGVNIYEVKQLMGHSTIAVTEMYAHLDTEKLHHSVDKINLT